MLGAKFNIHAFHNAVLEVAANALKNRITVEI